MLPLHVQTIVPELQALTLKPPRPPPPALPAVAACMQASPFMGVPGHGVSAAAPPWPVRPPIVALSPPELELVVPALGVPSPEPALFAPATVLVAPAVVPGSPVEPALPSPVAGSELPPQAATLAIPSMNNAHVSLVNFI